MEGGLTGETPRDHTSFLLADIVPGWDADSWAWDLSHTRYDLE